LILRKVLKPQLIGVFIAIVGAAIVFTGYLFNLVL
ncbi:permease, partial [Candidatus Parcubacteria bacterium]